MLPKNMGLPKPPQNSETWTNLWDNISILRIFASVKKCHFGSYNGFYDVINQWLNIGPRSCEFGFWPLGGARAKK